MVNRLAGIALASVALATPAVARAADAGTSQLALMPLPAGALGTQTRGLPLAADSGPLTNAQLAANANAKISGARLAALGSVGAYQLDYGGSAPAGGRLSQVETGVELYRTAAQARAGLAFWRSDATQTSRSATLGIHLSVSLYAVGGLGPGGFGDAVTATVEGLTPFHEADVAFQVGAVLGSVTLQGADPASLRALAEIDARALRARVEAVLAGRISGKPTALPTAKPGPPAHGPNLEAMAVRPSDFVSATLKSQGYRTDSSIDAIAEYQRVMAPAGTLGSFQEQVALFRSPVAAAFTMAILRQALVTPAGLTSSGFNTKGNPSYMPHPVAVRAGDAAFATLGVLRFTNGERVELGYVIVRVGSTLEMTIAADPTSIKLSAASLGQIADVIAARADAVVHPASTAHRQLPEA